MGRGKIEIKKIENCNSRQVTFTKRRGGLFKKARELAVLCDAEVAVIVFSSTGKLYDFASSSMERTLSRYKERVPSVSEDHSNEKQMDEELHRLREEMENLKASQMRLLGKDLRDLELKELSDIEQQLHNGLLSIKERKEHILLQQLHQLQEREHKSQFLNDTLRNRLTLLGTLLPKECFETGDRSVVEEQTDTSLHLSFTGSRAVRIVTEVQ